MAFGKSGVNLILERQGANSVRWKGRCGYIANDDTGIAVSG
jgi:hypothetical protein